MLFHRTRSAETPCLQTGEEAGLPRCFSELEKVTIQDAGKQILSWKSAYNVSICMILSLLQGDMYDDEQNLTEAFISYGWQVL
jgi:hypothetical protein